MIYIKNISSTFKHGWKLKDESLHKNKFVKIIHLNEFYERVFDKHKFIFLTFDPCLA